MAREKKTKVYPSQVKYRQENPIIGIRLTKSLKEILDSLRGNTSYSEFIRTVLTTKEKQLKEISNQAYNQGYNKAKEEHQIWYFCNVCQERINISPNSESHKAIIQYMEEHGWGHRSCHEKEKSQSYPYKDNAVLPPYFPHPYPPFYPPR